MRSDIELPNIWQYLDKDRQIDDFQPPRDIPAYYCTCKFKLTKIVNISIKKFFKVYQNYDFNFN